MSPRLLLATALIVLGGVAIGAGAGNFATGFTRSQQSAGPENSRSLDAAIDTADVAYGASAAADQTQRDDPVVCKGCGPTLSERESMAVEEDRFSTLGYDAQKDDPVVRRYMHDAAADEARQSQLDAERGMQSAPGPQPSQPSSSGTSQQDDLQPVADH